MRRLGGTIAACFGALILFMTAAAATDLPPPPRLSAPELTGHPLAGRIWRRADGAFISPAELAAALPRARYVLLGETHDNADHHRIQAWAVAVLFATGRRPGLALEMIRADQQDAVAAHLLHHPGDAAGLGAALGWARSGWPDWGLYAPVVAPFVREGLPVIGANLPRPAVQAILRGGFAGLTPRRRQALGLDRPPDADMLAAMAREIADAHCGMIDPDRALPFARVQFARDAALAEGLIRAAHSTPQDVSVLLAGSGHVRRDRGVPSHLARGDLGADRGHEVIVLAPMEVRRGLTRPAEYAAGFGAETLPFDYVWFTARMPRGDPCAAFKR